MTSEPPDLSDARANVLRRAEAVSRALSEAARRARFSARARGAYQNAGLSVRRGARAIRMFQIVSFIALAAIPDAAAIVYFAFLASDQYVSEAKFTVSSAAIPKLDELGSVTGVPSLMIFQDTMIVKSYIESRALVEALERQIDLRAIYASRDIDWWARFPKSKPVEKFVDYWTDMTKATIAYPSGIVTLTVRAFTPQDARRVAEAVVADCEALVNDLNQRMREDTVRASEQDLARAAERLENAWLALERARNAEGLIDVRQSSKAQSDILTELESRLLSARRDYQIQSRYVEESAPQMRVAKRQIEALEGQLAARRAELTAREGEGVKALADRALSGKMTTFARLDLEHQIAEKGYASSTAALEAARKLSERKLLYLHQIEAPATPEEARYPRRRLDIGLALAGSLALWGAVVGLAIFARNHMA